MIPPPRPWASSVVSQSGAPKWMPSHWMPSMKIAAEPWSKIGASAPPRLMAKKNIRYMTSRKIGIPSQRFSTMRSSHWVSRCGVAS
ncbi:hypothetical protein D3C78_1177540 [compost metagenome]